MLVLQRKRNEVIRIGHDIEVVVIRLKGGSVKLGIVAPKNTKVLRGELKDTKDEAA